MNGNIKHIYTAIYVIVSLILTSCSFNLQKDKSPLIYISDLYHPYNDPDDHFDLTAIYALKQFDLKAIIIDYANNDKLPGKIPIEQLNHITGNKVPYYYGLKEKLITPLDKGEDQKNYQDGCKAILQILRNSERKVTIISVGSLRDVTAAYNRDSILFANKVDKLVIFAGEARNRDFFEYNVDLDKNAYIRVMNNIPNVFWVPCFDGGLWKNEGLASFWRDHHSVLLNGASKPLLNYFLYAFKQSVDTINYIPFLYKKVNEDDLYKYITDNSIPLRNLWCCSVFPWFLSQDQTLFPFTFEKVKVRVDSSAVLQYSEVGNHVMRFRITDQVNYSNRMTAIYNNLIKQLK